MAPLTASRPTRAAQSAPSQYLFSRLAGCSDPVLLPVALPRPAPVSLVVKPVGKPDAAGVQFDKSAPRTRGCSRSSWPNRASATQRGLGKPETFCFLGFTHICGRSRRGTFQLQRKSRADRMRATLRRVKDALRRRMHQPIPVQGRWLTQVVNGYFAYHAVPTNRRALMAFRHHVTDLWRRTLRRRSQKDRLTWARMAKLADAWLPRPHLLHPWPSERFAVRHPRWEPSARIGPARIWCSEASCHSCG